MIKRQTVPRATNDRTFEAIHGRHRTRLLRKVPFKEFFRLIIIVALVAVIRMLSPFIQGPSSLTETAE